MLVPEYIAVYGTLRRGLGANHLLDEPAFTFHCEDQLLATMYAVGWYPGIIFNSRTNTVNVEVYKINDPTALFPIHAYEGYYGPDMNGRNDFNRNLFSPRVVTTINHELKVMCYEYTGNQQIAFPLKDNANKVKSGDWSLYLSDPATA